MTHNRFIIFAPFYKDFTRNGGTMIRIAGYTRGLEALGIDYLFYSYVKPEYVPNDRYIKSYVNGRWQKILTIHNLLYASVYLRPLSFPFRFILLKFSKIHNILPFVAKKTIWTHQEYTLALFLFFVYKVPFIYDIHGFFDIQREYRKDLGIWKKLWFDLYTIQERVVLRNAPYLNVVSEKMKEYVIRRFKTQSKILIAPDGIPEEIDVYQKTKANETFKIENKDFSTKKIILHAGSFKKFGGVTELVRVFVESPELNQKAVLILIGWGQEEYYIDKILDGSALKNSIFHFRSMPHEELISYMKIADVIVCPDLENNIYNQITPHIKLYDAIASGKKIVSTDFEVNRELFPEDKFPITYFSYGILNDFKNALLKSLETQNMHEINLDLLKSYTYKARTEKYLNYHE